MNIVFVLILFVHVGPMSNGNSNAITTAEFNSEKTCLRAGEKAKELVKNTVKQLSFVCVQK